VFSVCSHSEPTQHMPVMLEWKHFPGPRAQYNNSSTILMQLAKLLVCVTWVTYCTVVLPAATSRPPSSNHIDTYLLNMWLHSSISKIFHPPIHS
jgi:hypothetical protein